MKVEIKRYVTDTKTEVIESSVNVKPGDMVYLNNIRGNRFGIVVGINVKDKKYNKNVSIEKIKDDGRKVLSDQLKRYAFENNFKITDWAFSNYNRLTIGNKDTSKEQAELKLNRNIILGTKLKQVKRENNVVRFDYGSLRIYVNIKTNEIISVSNHHPVPAMWHRNEKKYEELNVQMGIK